MKMERLLTEIRSCTSSVLIFQARACSKNTIVTTVMSNLGFHKALGCKGNSKEITAVGDRYVVEEMRKSGYNLGGEQSGHVVIMDYNTTGDGQLTGVQLTKSCKKPARNYLNWLLK